MIVVHKIKVIHFWVVQPVWQVRHICPGSTIPHTTQPPKSTLYPNRVQPPPLHPKTLTARHLLPVQAAAQAGVCQDVDASPLLEAHSQQGDPASAATQTAAPVAEKVLEEWRADPQCVTASKCSWLVLQIRTHRHEAVSGTLCQDASIHSA
jgi:hypothetical protein